ncbi:hypothetical protein AUJ68_03240 [Candidatus Woesearchaeota archaeon CG1_02_57_44]|nr:MAG: hypothetical protein AUJ68_03240 [Candidatus Woesearchaeota archaeon CG1_02_57_44]
MAGTQDSGRMDGEELALRFSYITNTLRFCGPVEAQDAFLRYLSKKDNAPEVKAAVHRFEGLYPYLHAIAEKAVRTLLDHDVTEAYWLGNSLLDGFNKQDMAAIIEHLARRGLPLSLAEKLIADLPEGFVPHHDFNVLYVGVGNTTGSVPSTLQNMENCRISWGRVVDVLKNIVLVRARPLIEHEGLLALGTEETRTAIYLDAMLPDVAVGDIVALHWGMACMKLDERQLKNLSHYAGKVLDTVNALRAKPCPTDATV